MSSKIKEITQQNLVISSADRSDNHTTKQLIIGGASGWVTGFLMMKIGKMAAVTVGGSIILLQWANHKGYVNINWDKVIDKADKAARSVEASTSKKSNILDKVSELFTGNRPLPTEKCFFYSSKITHPLNSGPLRCEYQKCHVL
ncbi:hypothetical protein M8J75_014810 [Diaphorina citri]|nr:hypothetical protein M8J75_014810 [Diaphorina citri]